MSSWLARDPSRDTSCSASCWCIPMIWVILTLVFFILRVAPGDPVSAALGGKLNQQALDQRREALGLNRPLLAQYWDYLCRWPTSTSAPPSATTSRSST